jgi:type II restriction/modification system DNA methylase subunit YeeA
LEPLDNIECRDALLAFDGEQAAEAAWPQASVVIGNPPFLGDKKMRTELGDDNTTKLRQVYEGRVPGGADLVCYWFEKARQEIESRGLGAAGLVSTNSIRGGKNRKVLDAICVTTQIYEAWGDEGWVNDGAAVRVSLVAFGHSSQTAILDGKEVALLHGGGQS